MASTYFIKNMVCPRCIETVSGIFEELNISVKSIQLGEVMSAEKLDNAQKVQLSEKLEKRGFELLQDQKSKLISQIKSLLIDQIQHKESALKTNYSTYLTDNLHHEYSYLSKLFSTVEGITIEKFILKQKIERVKELIFYDELTLSQIAHQMDYSSIAHLSSQFKKETGMTPTAFKKLHRPHRSSLDAI